MNPHLPQPNITPTHYNCPRSPFLGRSGFILPLPDSFGFPLNPAGPGPFHSRLPNRNATHAGQVPALSDPATTCPADQVRHRASREKCMPGGIMTQVGNITSASVGWNGSRPSHPVPGRSRPASPVVRLGEALLPLENQTCTPC